MVAPKSGKERKIRLSPELTAVLRELARTRRARALAEGRELSPLVFIGPVAGRRATARVVEGVFAAGMAAIGATEEQHTIHDCRDTFATLHLQRHTPLAWVSAMLGHSKRSTTLDRYSKWIPTDADEDYAAALQRDDITPGLLLAATVGPPAKVGRLRAVAGRRRSN